MTSTCLVSCWSSKKSVFLAVNANRKKCEQILKPSQTRRNTINNKLHTINNRMSACLANVGDDKYHLMFYVTKIAQTKNTCAICDWKAYYI